MGIMEDIADRLRAKAALAPPLSEFRKMVEDVLYDIGTMPRNDLVWEQHGTTYGVRTPNHMVAVAVGAYHIVDDKDCAAGFAEKMVAAGLCCIGCEVADKSGDRAACGIHGMKEHSVLTVSKP